MVDAMEPDPSARDETLQNELSLQMWKQDAERIPHSVLTPKPLTVANLYNHLKHDSPWPLNDITVWVHCESEEIEETSIGQYKDDVPGYILRFSIEKADNPLIKVQLVPDQSDTGFSWYVKPNQEIISKDSELHLSQARRLKRLRESSNPEDILILPQQMLTASHFLERDLIDDEITPTPDEWVTTACKQSSESEFLLPRYDATFVHDSGAVLEVEGLPPTAAEREEANSTMEAMVSGSMGGPQPEPVGTAVPSATGTTNNDESTDDPDHKITLHFGTDSAEEFIKAQYGWKVTGNEIYRIMRMIRDNL